MRLCVCVKTRPELLREHVRQFFHVHEQFWDHFEPSQEDVGFMRKAMKIKGFFLCVCVYVVVGNFKSVLSHAFCCAYALLKNMF